MNEYGVSIQVKEIGYVTDELAEALADPDIGICGIDCDDSIFTMVVDAPSHGVAVDMAKGRLWERFGELDIDVVRGGEVRVWMAQ